jgi:hypothetical protein
MRGVLSLGNNPTVPGQWQAIGAIFSHTLCLNFLQHLEPKIMFYCWIAPRMNHDVK